MKTDFQSNNSQFRDALCLTILQLANPTIPWLQESQGPGIALASKLDHHHVL